jgi:hypothetical protein
MDIPYTHTHTHIYDIICFFTSMREGSGGCPFGVFSASSLPRRLGPSKSLECLDRARALSVRWCIGLDFVILLFTFDRVCHGPQGLHFVMDLFIYGRETHCFSTPAYLPGVGGLIDPSLGCSLVHQIRLCDDNNTPIHIGSLIGGPGACHSEQTPH